VGYRARPVSAPRSQRDLYRGLLLVVAAAGVVFAPVVTYGFAYDDHWTVENDPALAGPLAPLLRALLTGRAMARGIPDATRPAMVTSLWVDHRLFGADPAGHHLHSLAAYCVCVALATLAVFAVTRRRTPAVVGGAFFALSPLHAEAVAAVNYREDLLAALAVLGCLAWLFYPRKKPELVDHAVLAAALLLFGLLGKESAVALVPMVLVVVATRRSARSLGSARGRSLLAMGTVLLGWCAWRAWLRLSGRDDVPVSLVHRGPVERLLRTGRYSTRMVLDALVPVRWSPDHAPEGVPSPAWLVALAALVTVAVVLARRRRDRPFALGLGFALVAALPTSPLVSPINETADRYAFLATLGGAVVWGTLASRVERWVPRRLRATVLVVLLLPLAVVSRRAMAPWQSDETLWRAATERSPTSARAWTALARALRLGGHLDESDAAVDRAVRLDPSFLRARVTRVYNRLARGEVARARAEIAEIRALGGARQLGMRHAEACAALPSEAAAACIDPRPPERGH
jgi:hypothetical protein